MQTIYQIFLLCLEIAKPAGAVNGQDERSCAAVDSPAHLCCSVIKRATAQNAAALCHYSERGIFHDRTRKVSRTYPAYTRCFVQDRHSPCCHRRSPEHTQPPWVANLATRGFRNNWSRCMELVAATSPWLPPGGSWIFYQTALRNRLIKKTDEGRRQVGK